ncbi:MAG: DUF6444 domain-containing protein, partial [Clostridiales bacterium]|nr:DUF6444 domain-containing protein [Clostridiales bacterium]
ATAPLIEEIITKSNALKKAESEIDRLKSQLNKNSGNSSKSPSQDGLKKIPNSREKSNHKSGGQKGHQGKRLELPKNLNELIENKHAYCKMIDHTNGAESFALRWVHCFALSTFNYVNI